MGRVNDIAAELLAADRTCRCPLNKIFDQLDEADSSELTALIDNARVHATVVTEVIRRLGFAIGRDAVRSHRKQLCSCFTRRDGRGGL